MSKEAMKLAHEALENWVEYFPQNVDDIDKKAIAALETALAEQPAQQEPVACANGCRGFVKHSPPAQRTWVDPNDKTQKQYLPHIGEPVLFCHKGAIYTGKHTGGSFQSEVTNQYFNTWECHWMYLPAAHGIKENT